MNHRRRGQCFFGFVLFFPAFGVLAAQTTEPSHRERFTSSQVLQQRAEQKATGLLEREPNSAQAWSERGRVRLEQGRLELATEDLRRAATLEPARAERQADLAFVLLLRGNWEEALAAARATLKLDAGNSAANAYAGHVLLRQGDLDAALPYLERAATRIPGNIDVRFDLLESYRQKGDFGRAWVEMRLLRHLLQPTDPRLIYQEGVLHADQGNLEVAIERFRAVLVAVPAMLRAREDLSVALIDAGRTGEALDVLAPMARQLPRSFTAAYLHALALDRASKAAEAEAEARRAVGLDPEQPEAHLLLGNVLRKLGREAEASQEEAIAERLRREKPDGERNQPPLSPAPTQSREP